LNYWLLTTEYPPHYGGGISTYCYHTGRMLAGKGHTVTVFLPDEGIKDHEISWDGPVRMIRFSPARTGLEAHLGHLARLSYAFACIVRDMILKFGKPDCIESQEYLAIPYYLLQYKLMKYPEFAGIPIILTLHSPAFLYLYYNREGIYQFPNYWIGEMEKSCIRSADWLISPSEYIIGEIKKHFPVDETRTSVIRNPYHFEDLPATQRNIRRNSMVFYGKLSPQKGVFELFAYLKELWDDGFPHGLTVIGDEEKVYYPDMMTMGQLIREKYGAYLKKGLIRFTGRIPPAKRDEFLSDAHVILIPSRHDNLPYACIEAMSIGKTVLASVQGGQGEIIQDGINGFLFDHRDPGSFGKKLNQVLSLDEASLTRIGKTAMEDIRVLLSYEPISHQKMAVIDQIPQQPAGSTLFPYTRSAYPDATLSVKADRDPKLLSVVIPFYNLGNTIRECVASVLASTYKPIDVLIIDDGSADKDSVETLKELERVPRVRVVHKKNEGLAATRNFGAKLANGEFLAFLDADDKIHPDYYKKAITVLEQYRNVFFVGAWVQYFGLKKDKWITWNPEPPYILLHNSVNSSGLVYKKAAFEEGGLNDKAVDYGLEDYESVINMLSHGFRGVVIPEFLFYYRIRKNSMYRSLTLHKTLYSYQYISNKHSDFYNSFAPQLFNLLNANGPSFAYDNPSFEIEVHSKNILPRNTVNRLKTVIKRNPFLKKTALRIIKILKLR